MAGFGRFLGGPRSVQRPKRSNGLDRKDGCLIAWQREAFTLIRCPQLELDVVGLAEECSLRTLAGSSLSTTMIFRRPRPLASKMMGQAGTPEP